MKIDAPPCRNLHLDTWRHVVVEHYEDDITEEEKYHREKRNASMYVYSIE